MLVKFKLNLFRDIYYRFKTKNKIINHLLYGFLFWIEEHFIDWKVNRTLDKAIAPLTPPDPSLPQPIYSEELDGPTPLGGEMRLTASWQESDDSISPGVSD